MFDHLSKEAFYSTNQNKLIVSQSIISKQATAKEWHVRRCSLKGVFVISFLKIYRLPQRQTFFLVEWCTSVYKSFDPPCWNN